MSSTAYSFDTKHEDMIHDVQMNYYGRRMATCSSDRTIKIWDVALDSSTTLTSVLKGHEGAVWQVSWAHPKFGNYLASSSYDRKVIIWKEVNKNEWKTVFEYSGHEQSVNSVAWAPQEFGLILACGSSDGFISILVHQGGDKFVADKFKAHDYGVNGISWAPVNTPTPLKRLASAGCDNLVKTWRYYDSENKWRQEESLSEHKDWVRDVAWAPSIGLPTTTIASGSQDGTVIIWTQDDPNGPVKVQYTFDIKDVVWRLSWSITGNILAVSGGNNVVTLWKEDKDGVWQPVYSMDENGQLKDNQQ
eukprot:TRINITY_DN18540_c0_g1_i1.p1 TRINITY_DN18540_c0_g1~~TRINITY_DN18540_c0_g1_i1.p1  ORF type:complete len:304 (-),score=61.00 TRINITY_DN18540_c0_g1_i1:24-935(-)